MRRRPIIAVASCLCGREVAILDLVNDGDDGVDSWLRACGDIHDLAETDDRG
jgi:hypothetical protein